MFETPLFLIAAALGALIPLFLHMMRKRKSTPVPFPTLRFLKLAQHASARRLRIEHLLLWLLRTLIMALLGIAFAMPMLRARGLRFLGQAPRDVGIVLDRSYSMGYRIGRETVWDRAVATAAGIIEGLGEADRFCIYLAHREPRALIAEPIGDKATGLAKLDALRPGNDTSRLLPAADAAWQAMHAASGRRQRELHIITDNQAIPWTAASPVMPAPDDGGPSLSSDKDTTVFISLLGVPAPENITSTSVGISPSVLFAGQGGQLTVHPGFTGPSRDTTLTLLINDEEIARRPVTVGTPEGESVVFAVPPLPAGNHAARVETPADNLPDDDSFHFLIRVRKALPVLVAGEENDTFFLRTALHAAAGDGVTSAWITPAMLEGERFDSYACVFLCNALPLQGQSIGAMEHFVRRGGILVVFPGLRANASAYQAWRSLPGIPEAIRDVTRTRSRQTLVYRAPEHPILHGLSGTMTLPTLALHRELAWEALPADTATLIAFDTGQPFLLERPLGEGRILMFAVSADRQWSNFPLTPFYLPVIVQIIGYSGALGASPPFMWGRDILPVEAFLPDADPATALFSPQGLPVHMRSIAQEGRATLYIEDIRGPGIYRQRGANGMIPVLAINMPRDESDLTPMSAETIATRMDARDLHIATDQEMLETLLRELRIGRTYGELLLWIVFFLACLEFIYANRLARPRGPAAPDLLIATSGQVHAPAPPGRTREAAS